MRDLKAEGLEHDWRVRQAEQKVVDQTALVRSMNFEDPELPGAARSFSLQKDALLAVLDRQMASYGNGRDPNSSFSENLRKTAPADQDEKGSGLT